MEYAVILVPVLSPAHSFPPFNIFRYPECLVRRLVRMRREEEHTEAVAVPSCCVRSRVGGRVSLVAMKPDPVWLRVPMVSCPHMTGGAILGRRSLCLSVCWFPFVFVCLFVLGRRWEEEED